MPDRSETVASLRDQLQAVIDSREPTVDRVA